MRNSKLAIITTILAALCHFIPTLSFAFAEDLCFRGKDNSLLNVESKLANCRPLPHQCRTDQLSFSDLIKCKIISVIEVVSAPRRSARIDLGRSMLHFDATYYLAQSIGFSPKDAYQIALFDQVSDTGEYIPYDMQGNLLLNEDEIQACRLDMSKDEKCQWIAPLLNGISRRNFVTGGVFLHLGARYADKPTPPNFYPVDYLSTPEIEKILSNLKNWVYSDQSVLCVAGLTVGNKDCVTFNEEFPKYINGHLVFLERDKIEYLNLNIKLGELIIHSETDKNGNVIPGSVVYSHQLNDYLKVHKVANAKLGIFLHALQDRYSHHKCMDMSNYYKNDTGHDYYIKYNNETCDQGTHILSHAWEVGNNQSDLFEIKNITLKPALSATYDELMQYAKIQNIVMKPNLNKDRLIDDLVQALQIENAQLRLEALVKLFEMNGLVPLPGHGNSSIAKNRTQ